MVSPTAPRAYRNREGIALLELITALVIVSIGLLGVVQMYQIGIAKIRETQRRAIAMRAIDNEIETIRAVPHHELVTGTNLPWRSDVTPLEILNEPSATLDIKPSTRPSLLELTVRLQWRERARTVTREVVTLLGAAP